MFSKFCERHEWQLHHTCTSVVCGGHFQSPASAVTLNPLKHCRDTAAAAAAACNEVMLHIQSRHGSLCSYRSLASCAGTLTQAHDRAACSLKVLRWRAYADLHGSSLQEPGKSRYDFDTEEQWQSYKNSKEAAPKAAFQFGLKRSDGRKAHKDLGKHQDGKINSQLNKIKGILEKDVSALSGFEWLTAHSVLD